MRTKQHGITFFLILATVFQCLSQACPAPLYPADGASGIPVDATLTWTDIQDVNNYLVTLGTTPGGSELLDRESMGNENSYTAPLGLPPDTRLYLSVDVALTNGTILNCSEISFRTAAITEAPGCSILLAPDDNAFNVTVVTDIEWQYSPTANGYYLYVGTGPGLTDLVDGDDVGNVLIYDPPVDLPQSTHIHVRVVPYNERGAAIGCQEESFFTGPAEGSCDTYVDSNTGLTVTPSPQIDFPDQVGICSSDLPFTITTEDEADGFRWYSIGEDGGLTLLSEGSSLSLNGTGRYWYEAYNEIPRSGDIIQCSSSKLFTVVASEIATITDIEIFDGPGGRQVTVFAEGSGDYEYALDDASGPYQSVPVFEEVAPGSHIAYVRDKNGCGIAERGIDRDLLPEDFPKFFTPNGDGINDHWNIIPPEGNWDIGVATIFIFNRYGNLIAQIFPDSLGWDGRFNGSPLPSDDYWFQAIATNDKQIKGHFSLKR